MQVHPQPVGDQSLRRAYWRALCRVLIGWWVGLAAVVGLALAIEEINLVEALVIAIASVCIAWLAMLPGLTSPPLVPARSGQRLSLCLFVGMAIRLAGTVALFLTCRYYMATSIGMIAGMTIGWYTLLTSVEIHALTRELPGAAKLPPFAETSLG